MYFFFFFFFNDTATTEIYTLSLHDALPISPVREPTPFGDDVVLGIATEREQGRSEEHTSELQSHSDLVCRLLLEKQKNAHQARLGRARVRREPLLRALREKPRVSDDIKHWGSARRLQAALRAFGFFFFNDTATTEIYTLSLHDALPISSSPASATTTSPFRASCCLRTTTRSEEHTSELQSHSDLVCRLLLEKKKKK